MRYKKGDIVKIISLEKVRSLPSHDSATGTYYDMPGQSWAAPEMDKYAGTVQIIEDVNTLGFYQICGWAFSEKAIERSATPIECLSIDALKCAKAEQSKHDPVNRPAHYTSGKIEVIDFIADQRLDFPCGNAVKYIARAGKKDPAKEREDLQKAVWYLNWKIDRL